MRRDRCDLFVQYTTRDLFFDRSQLLKQWLLVSLTGFNVLVDDDFQSSDLLIHLSEGG